ncbi:MAG: hypothetical protein WAL10_09020 [Acetobacteraceae bacterium]|jgi:hypothetical protein
MADILLAEFEGRVWLVSGEVHLDDLLANTLSPDVSVELVPCESVAAVRDQWARHGGDPSAGMPWLVHPNVVARVMGVTRGASPDHAVMFGPWSVLLDQAALAVIEAAAAQANRQPEATITLAEYLDPAGPQAIADLSRLRAQLIEDQLAAQGVARERISRVRRAVSEVPGMAQESQRVDILLGP